MSSPEFRLRLSHKARRDLTDILRYTAENWGKAQLLVYRDLVDHALETIRLNPAIGHRHEDLPETHRVYLVGSHVIVYRALTTGIAVVRILHQRMSLGDRV